MRRLLTIAATGFALLSGCALAPRVSEPVGQSELAALVDAINGAAPLSESYRGTGDG